MRLWYLVVERYDMHGNELEPYVIGPYDNCADPGDDAREGLVPLLKDIADDLFRIEELWVTVRPPAGQHIPREALVA